MFRHYHFEVVESRDFLFLTWDRVVNNCTIESFCFTRSKEARHKTNWIWHQTSVSVVISNQRKKLFTLSLNYCLIFASTDKKISCYFMLCLFYLQLWGCLVRNLLPQRSIKLKAQSSLAGCCYSIGHGCWIHSLGIALSVQRSIPTLERRNAFQHLRAFTRSHLS